ncbi:hypothetical protein C7999DRAFT_11965 [Corynascus novoguineensis]|uniref:C2H2-type domain-containing protein n=1 Tax=Corynascus novoguineensis TaxID=1126955 RepID=A0AAN7CXM9_9PEZI|nr:hypothetical protein C7999DRAFT_11965 [Corynascus novoguineensis]
MGITCRECNVEVASRAALIAHWEERRKQDEQHYHCKQCMQLFYTSEDEDRHSNEQDLASPGCDERLIAASGLLAHIESNRLKRVKNDDYASRCKETLAFTRGPVRREYEDPDMPEHLSVVNLKLAKNAATKNGQYNFTQDISRAKKLKSDVSTNGLGGKVEKLPLSAWSQGKKLFNNGAAPVRPPAVGRTAVHQPVETKKADGSVHDPRNPGWDPKDYYIAYLDKYKCPYDRCPRSFSKVVAFRGHLLSASHAGLARVQCPRCCNWFNSMAAMTAHAESQSVRCDLRGTNGYRYFLDQLTAGLMDTAGKHVDGINVYMVPDTARQFFSTSQGVWAAKQRKQQDDRGFSGAHDQTQNQD